MKKALVALAVASAMTTAHAGVLLEEGFNNVGDLASKGWVFNNASSPSGLTGPWYQGDQTQFAAQGGAAESYIATNYNAAAPGGTLNNWLITPEFSTQFGATVSFWLRAGAEAGYSDQIAFGFSDGSSELSAFTLDPLFTVGTDGWVKYVAHIGASDGFARFAIQYTGAADFANYVGLDSLVIANDVPEPSSVAILLAGVMGLAAARRRQRA